MGVFILPVDATIEVKLGRNLVFTRCSVMVFSAVRHLRFTIHLGIQFQHRLPQIHLWRADKLDGEQVPKSMHIRLCGQELRGEIATKNGI